MPFMTLSRLSFPFLKRSGASAPLQWNHGVLYNLLLSTDTVRFSENGISWCVMCDFDHSFLQGLAPTGTQSFACVPALNALCAVPVDRTNPNPMRLFPSAAVNVPIDHDLLMLPTQLQGFLRNATNCQSKVSRRQLVVDSTQYDVSLCDLVHNKFHFTLFPDQAAVVMRQSSKSVVVSVLVTLVTLFFFTKTCEAFANIVRGRPRSFSLATIVAMSVMLVYSVVITTHNNFLAEERLISLILQFYSLVYIVVAAWPQLAR